MLSPTQTAGAITILQQAQLKIGERAKTNPTANLQATLNAADLELNRQQIIRSSLLRLQGVTQEVIQPANEFEQTGGFLTLTGQPFKVFFDDQGQIFAEAQRESSLSEYSTRQQELIKTALPQLEELIASQDLANTKSDLLAEISFGALRVAEMNELFSPPSDVWEFEYQALRDSGNPVKVGLDANGKLTAIDVLKHDFSEVENELDRLKLIAARNELSDILAGNKAATEPWQFLALGNKAEGDDYFIDLDESGNIVTLRNKADTITPEFLTEDATVTTTEKWQEDALAFYAEGKGFYFDFDSSGQNLIVKEVNFGNVSGILDPLAGLQNVGASLVSLLA